MISYYHLIYTLLHNTAQYNLLTITHKMEGEVVTVTRCEDSASYTDPTTESLPQCTVVVKGLTYSDKDDAIDHLELYFSNSKKGGGEIADDGIVVMKGRAHVTFVDSKGWCDHVHVIHAYFMYVQ